MPCSPGHGRKGSFGDCKLANTWRESNVALGNDRAWIGGICRDAGFYPVLRLGVIMNILMLLLSLLVGAYLFYAMVRPERF
jgi:K+-transporting ATPase KdpF subunit